MTPEDMLYNNLMWCLRNSTTIIAYDIRDDILNQWEGLSVDAKNLIIAEVNREISFNQCGSLVQKWKIFLEDIKKKDV